MGHEAPVGRDAQAAFLAFYDEALPHVYGYLVARCGHRTVAEDLTTETFLAAVDAARRDEPPALSTGWAVGVARHKLADHWRRQARDERRLAALAGSADRVEASWEARLNAVRVRHVLDHLRPEHRAALTLRYFDDLPVAEVAALLGRGMHATEGLLVRARAAFRRAYGAEEAGDA